MDGCCTLKYPPQTGVRGGAVPVLPNQQGDGGIRATFGRHYSLVYPPTGWRPLPEDSRPPDCALRREYVYGYNGACKRSIHFISDEEIIYPVSALVVIQNLFDMSKQRYFEGHNRGVLCIDWNVERGICASGQSDPKGAGGPYVCVWAPAYCERTISELHHHVRQVSALAISADGKTVVSFGKDDAHTLCIWRDFAAWDGVTGPQRDRLGMTVPTEKKAPVHCISTGRVTTRCVFMGPWAPERGEQRQRTLTFYSVGEPEEGAPAKSGVFKHWTVTVTGRPGQEPEVSSKRGVFGKAAVPQQMTCIAFSEEPGVAFMVADNGYFYVITNGTATQSRRIIPPKSATSLGCVAALAGGRWIAGGSDGTLYRGRCDPAPTVEETFKVMDLVGPEGALFCSTAQIKLAGLEVRGSRLALGTSNHALFLADLSQQGTGQVLQVSHTDEAWAMDFHPSLAILATASSAKDIRFWNVAERRPAVGKVLRLQEGVAAMAFNPEGSLLALGCGAGILEVHGFPSLQPIFKQLLSRERERIVDVVFSHDGQLLAAACWDQAIYLLKVAGFGTRNVSPGVSASTPAKVAVHKVLTGNSSSPVCVMFSADGEYLMSNSKDTQILFWRTKDGSRNSAISAFRDMPWQEPWTCVLGWPVLGLWGDSDYDQTDVNSVCQSSPPNDGYIALGDDYGKIKLFRFPNPFVDPPCRVYAGHASHVTKLKFSQTNVLAALGGDDHSISQWSLDFQQRAARKEPEPMVHPWVQLEEAEGGPRDRFGFLGRPRAASAPRVAARPPVDFEEPLQSPSGSSHRRMPPPHRLSSPSGRQGGARGGQAVPGPGTPPGRPGATGGRRPASASGIRRTPSGGYPPPAPRASGSAQAQAYDRGMASRQDALPRNGAIRSNSSQGVGSALRWD